MYTKILFRNKLRIIIMAFLILGTMICNLRILSFHDVNLKITPLNAFLYQEQLAYYLFLVMLFLSFDYYREFKDSMVIERLTLSSDRVKCTANLLLRMMFVVTIYSTVQWLFTVAFWGRSGVLNKDTLLYLTKNAVIFFFSTGLLASILSLCISLYMRTMWGYVFLFITALLLGPLADYSLQILSGLFGPGTSIVYYFSIFPGTYFEVNPYTAITGNLTNLAKIMMWISLLMILIMLRLRYRKKILSGIVLAICIISTIITVKSDYAFNNATPIKSMNSIWCNSIYYINNHIEKEESADFIIDSYKMNLEITSRLNADILIKMNDNDLTKYRFTLQHMYEIDKITDGSGNKLKYDRSGDYLLVRSGSPLNEIRIIYHGGNPEFYSSYDQLFLPGFFPYYPVAGYNMVYDDSKNEYMDNSYDYPIYFDVTVRSSARIYSNLELNGKNSFKGYSTCPIFESGFIEEDTINGIRCVNQYMAKETSNQALYTDYFIEYVTKAMGEEDMDTLIFIPSSTMKYPTITDGKTLISNDLWFALAENYDANGDFTKKARGMDVSEELRIERFKCAYYLNEMDELNDYDTYYYFYQRFMLDDTTESEQNFEKFFKEQIGINEWERLIEGR